MANAITERKALHKCHKATYIGRVNMLSCNAV